MIYTDGDGKYIYAECPYCGRELAVDGENVEQRSGGSIILRAPARCPGCGGGGNVITDGVPSARSLASRLEELAILIARRDEAEGRITAWRDEFETDISLPSIEPFLWSSGRFALKALAVTAAVLFGLELILGVICGLLYLLGSAFGNSPVMDAGAILFYYANIFRGMGGGFVREYDVPPGEVWQSLSYLPAALIGLALFTLIVAAAVSVVRLGYGMTVYAGNRHGANKRRELLESRRGEYEAALGPLAAEIEELNGQIEQCSIIPPQYRNAAAVGAFIGYLTGLRAATLREAVRLYHEEEGRRELLECGAELLAELRRVRKYARATFIVASNSRAKVEVREDD